MKNRGPITLFILILALAAVAWWYWKKNGTIDHRLLHTPSEEIVAITLSSPGGELFFSQKNENWLVSDGQNSIPAKTALLSPMMAAIQGLSWLALEKQLPDEATESTEVKLFDRKGLRESFQLYKNEKLRAAWLTFPKSGTFYRIPLATCKMFFQGFEAHQMPAESEQVFFPISIDSLHFTTPDEQLHVFYNKKGQWQVNRQKIRDTSSWNKTLKQFQKLYATPLHEKPEDWSLVELPRWGLKAYQKGEVIQYLELYGLQGSKNRYWIHTQNNEERWGQSNDARIYQSIINDLKKLSAQ
jgi:hypothetical protein